LSIQRGRERDGFAFSRGGADEVGFDPNEEETTTNEGKSVRSLALPTRLTLNTQMGSQGA